jgi:hypothetical protein
MELQQRKQVWISNEKSVVEIEHPVGKKGGLHACSIQTMKS